MPPPEAVNRTNIEEVDKLGFVSVPKFVPGLPDEFEWMLTL